MLVEANRRIKPSFLQVKDGEDGEETRIEDFETIFFGALNTKLLTDGVTNDLHFGSIVDKDGFG